jgi:hypothetical protein
METSYIDMTILALCLAYIHMDNKRTMYHLNTGMWHFQCLNRMEFRYQGFIQLSYPPPHILIAL